MAQPIHKMKPLPPRLQVQMQNTAMIYLNLFYKRIINPKDNQPLTVDEKKFNLYEKTRALIFSDRIAIYGAMGD